MTFEQILHQNRIIAATEQKDVDKANESKVSALIIMHGKLGEIIHLPEKLTTSIKPVFLHTDLIKGLGNDKEAINFLTEHIKPSGIVSTKSPMIRAAKKKGLITIQRVFLIDTGSLRTTIENIKENQPDAIEIMPGIAPSIIKEFKQELKQTIILGGLIWSEKQVHDAIDGGADAVSLSQPFLWNYQI